MSAALPKGQLYLLNKGRVGTAHQRKDRPDQSMVGDAHPTKIALLQLVQDVIIPKRLLSSLSSSCGFQRVEMDRSDLLEELAGASERSDSIRIISARKATESEQRIYFEQLSN